MAMENLGKPFNYGGEKGLPRKLMFKLRTVSYKGSTPGYIARNIPNRTIWNDNRFDVF